MRIYKITVFFPYNRTAFNTKDKFVLANSRKEAEEIVNEHYSKIYMNKNCWSIHNIESIRINKSKLL